MAIDIEAIRKTLARISAGNNRETDTQYKRWKYDKPGTYTVRVLPFKNADPGMPFPQRQVFYGSNVNPAAGGMIVSPEHIGQKDPFKEMRISMFNEAKEKSKEEAAQLVEMAKKLNSKTVTCVAVIDRANEAAGPQMFSPNWTDAQALLALFLSDAGDYTDLKDGCDLNLVVVEGKKKNQRTGKPVLEANISAARKNSPAAKDDATLKSWLEQMPDPDVYYKANTTEEASAKLHEWLNAGESDESDGTSRGGQSSKSESATATPSKASVAAIAASMAKNGPSKKASKPLLQQAEDDLDKELADLDS